MEPATVDARDAEDIDKHIEGDDGVRCEWRYETPDRVMPPQEVRAIVISLRKAFQRIVKREMKRLSESDEVKMEAIQRGVELSDLVKEKMPTDEAIREEILGQNALYREFAKANQSQKTFTMVCSYGMQVEEFESLVRMCTLREIVNEGKLTEENGKAIVGQSTQRRQAILKLQEKSKDESLSADQLQKVLTDLRAAINTPDPLQHVCDLRRRGRI